MFVPRSANAGHLACANNVIWATSTITDGPDLPTLTAPVPHADSSRLLRRPRDHQLRHLARLPSREPLSGAAGYGSTGGCLVKEPEAEGSSK